MNESYCNNYKHKQQEEKKENTQSKEVIRNWIKENPRTAYNIISTMYADDDETKNELLHDWDLWARDEQRVITPPSCVQTLLLCGRGWGKSHYISNKAIHLAQSNPGWRILLMAADFNNLKQINFLGDSGIISLINPDLLKECSFNASDLTLEFPNGSKIISYSAEAYQKTRGQQFHAGILDELAAWTYARDAFDACKLTMRLGDNPHLYIATTPRPTEIIKALSTDDKTYMIKGTTYDNYYLPPQYIDELKRTLTDRMFRQECLAEILDDNPYALWKMSDIEAARINQYPELKKIVVAIDPAVTSNPDSDETGIVVCGIDVNGHGYVLDDCSVSAATPDQWAKKAIEAYYQWGADRIVAEVNQGGDMVESVIRNADRKIPPVKKVRASKGKELRAEPIAAFYERHEVHHVGRFDSLERQQTEWNPTDKRSKSPDRVDALVWGLTELMTKAKGNVKVSLG